MLKHVLKYRFFLVFVVGVSSAVSYESTNLTKLFYHQGLFGDKVVCYFDKAPICNALSSVGEGDSETKKIEYFLPLAKLADGKARSMMEKVNGTKRDSYTISFKEEEKPVKGIKVSIVYDPAVVVCDYATCDSISAQKSVVFNFHNKQGLEAIKVYGNTILRQVANHPKPHIMLDFGHGGEDDGKVGCFMVKEKDINRQVGMKLARLLEKKGYNVILSRTADAFIPLDERTTEANSKRVDLFVSLHSNAGISPKISGIETYWTPRSFLKGEQLRKEKQCESLVGTLYKELDASSKTLAMTIHEKVLASLSCKYSVVNRKVKTSVAQVLLGTDMPSALIEMGFLSNPDETKRLTNSAYQQLLAQGICAGIESYCKEKRLI